MNETSLVNNLPLNGDLKSLRIGEEIAPIELSKTKVRIKNLDVTGDFNVAGQDDNLLDRVGTNTYVKNTGDNFSIGTTSSEGAQLHIKNNPTTNDVGLTVESGDAGSYVSFKDNSSSNWYNNRIGAKGNTLVLQTDATDRITIDNSGKVGIGTASPDNVLTIQEIDASNPASIRFNDTDGAELGMIGNASATNSLITGSTNWDLCIVQTKASRDILFATNDTEVMRILDSGNVGIGTTSPSSKLSVNGSLSADTLGVTNASTFSGSLLLQSSIQVLNKAQSAYIDLSARDTSGSEVVYNLSNIGSMTASGNVGIGTTTPDEQLTIAGADAQDAHFSMWGDRGDDSDDGIRFRVTNSGVLHIGTSKTAGLSGTPAWDERVSLIRGGNVGIGTTSPSYTLTVEGQSEFENSSTDDVILAKVTTDSVHKFAINTSGQMTWGDGSNSRDTNLYRDSANKLRTADTFIVDGNVGIGTTSPIANLHIAQTSTSGASLRVHRDLASGSTDSEMVGFHQDNTGDDQIALSIRQDGTGNILKLSDGGTDVFAVIDGGNVGIGTTSPETKMHIQNGSAGTIATVDGAVLTLESNEKPKIHFQSPNAYGGSIVFGSVADSDEGQIDYDSGSDRFLFKTGGATKMAILGDNVGIGETSPQGQLHIKTGETDASAHSGSDELVLEGTGDMGISLLSATSGAGVINFGDSGDNNIGSIEYQHSNNSFKFTTNATAGLWIDSSQKVGIGTSSPDGNLHIQSATAGSISAHADADELTIEGSGHSGIQILSGTSSSSNIFFGDSGSNQKGIVRYSHANDNLQFNADAGTRMILDTNSRISLSNNDSGTSNTVFGYQAGNLIGSGDNYNVFIGHQVADADMTNATNNVGVGYQALYALTEGDANTAVGSRAGNIITDGGQNTIIGQDADPSASGGANQTVVGYGTTGQADNSVTLGNASVTAVYMAQDKGATVHCGDINVQYEYIHVGFNYAESAGTFCAIPLRAGTRPFTTFVGNLEKACLIAPHNGTLEVINFRSEEVGGNPVVIGFHKATNGTEVPSDTPTVSTSVDMSGVADDTTTAFAFSLSNSFNRGDVLGFSIDPANDVDDCLMVITLKYDTTT